MAVLLAAAINATQQRLTLTEALSAQPGDLLRIGDEVVEFGGYGRIGPEMRLVDHSRKIISVARGIGDTTAASHLINAPVLRVADGLVSGVTPPDPFVSGGAAQTVSLLGPYTVDFDTPGLGDDGVILAVLDPLTVVIRTWIVIDEAFDAAGDNGLDIAIGGPDAGPPDDDYGVLIHYGVLTSAGPAGLGYIVEAGLTGDTADAGVLTAALPVVGLLTGAEPGALLAYSSNLPNGTQGSGRVYALIATPS